MLNKKAQGLPINTIILIAIGLLILVLFIVFVLGGFSGFTSGTKSNPYSSFSASCQSACSEDQLSGASYPIGWCTLNTTISGSTVYCDSTGMSGYAGGSCTIGGKKYTASGSSCPTQGH